MICRIWHGWTTGANADSYESLLRTEIFAGIAAREIPGFVGIDLMRRDGPDEVEFVTVARSLNADTPERHFTPLPNVIDVDANAGGGR